MLSTSVKVGLALIAAAVLYQLHCPRGEQNSQVAELADRWQTVIRKPRNAAKKIALGVNANLDLVVSATSLLRALGTVPSPGADHASLSSPAQLQELVAHSMQHCVGTERVLTDREAFQRTVVAAVGLEHEYHIGGNAALMGTAIQHFVPEAQVMLVAPVGAKLRSLLHPSMATPTFTPSSEDEVHMILEYAQGEQWGNVTAPCANRVIYSHDLANSRLLALDDVRERVGEFGPDLIILSGAHLLDGQPSEFWQQRLRDIEGLLESLRPLGVPVHWELGTVGNLDFFASLAESVFARVDSLGLNEQELVSVAKALGARFNFSSIAVKPSIEDASDLLHWLMETFGAGGARADSRLTRVHFHSLTFHIVGTVGGGGWGDSRSAVQAGTRVAGLQACNTERFQLDKFELRIPAIFSVSRSDSSLSKRVVEFNASQCPVQWQRSRVDYALSPVLVCKKPLKTVGLGDAISTLGLLYSEYSKAQYGKAQTAS